MVRMILSLAFSVFVTLPTMAHAERWQQITPGDPDSILVDLDSVTPYVESTSAMTKTPKIYADRAPKGLKLPTGAVDYDLLEVQCHDGAIGYTIERRILDRNGKTLYRDVPDPIKVQRKITQMYEMAQGQYGQTTAGLVCAYAASRCTNKPFTWPIPNVNPLYGQGVAKTPEEATARIARYTQLSDEYIKKFKPKCTGAEHGK